MVGDGASGRRAAILDSVIDAIVSAAADGRIVDGNRGADAIWSVR
jgi:hypothetical protein